MPHAILVFSAALARSAAVVVLCSPLLACGAHRPTVAPIETAPRADETEIAEAVEEARVPARTFAPIIVAGGRAFALLEEVVIDGLPMPTDTLDGDGFTLVLAAHSQQDDGRPRVALSSTGSICQAAPSAVHFAMVPGRGTAFRALELLASSVASCVGGGRAVLVEEQTQEVLWFTAHRESDPGAAVGSVIEGELDGSLMTFTITTPPSEDALCPGTPAVVEIWEGAVQHGVVTVDGPLVSLRGVLQLDDERYVWTEWGASAFQITRLGDAQAREQRWPIGDEEICDCCD